MYMYACIYTCFAERHCIQEQVPEAQLMRNSSPRTPSHWSQRHSFFVFKRLMSYWVHEESVPSAEGDCSQQGMKVHLALWKTFNVSKTGGVHQRVPGPGSWRLRGADAPDGNTCPCSVTSSLRRDNASHSRCSSSPLRFIFEICWSEGSGRIRGCRYTFFLLKGWCPKVNLMS